MDIRGKDWRKSLDCLMERWQNTKPGKENQDTGYIVKLAQKFGLTTDYVLGIEKPKPAPLSYSAAALEFARQFDRLDGWGQAAVSAIVRKEAARCEAPAAELAEIIELPHSLNPRYPDIVPADGETILCKGLVLGKLAAAWIVSK